MPAIATRTEGDDDRPRPADSHVGPPQAIATITTAPTPSGLAGFGERFGPWAQMGIAGAGLIFFYMILSSQIHSGQQQHKDTMDLVIRTLDRVENNQQSNQTQFTAMQVEMRSRLADSDRKHEDLVKEIKAVGEKNAEAMNKNTEAIQKLLTKMPGN